MKLRLDVIPAFHHSACVQREAYSHRNTCKPSLDTEVHLADGPLNTRRTCVSRAVRHFWIVPALGNRGRVFLFVIRPRAERTLNRRPPCVMALLPAAGFNVCELTIKPERWHHRLNLGRGSDAARNSQPAVSRKGTGPQSNLVGKLGEPVQVGARAGADCDTRKLADPGLDGMRWAYKKVSASRPLESVSGGYCGSKLAGSYPVTRTDTNAAKPPASKREKHSLVAAFCLRQARCSSSPTQKQVTRLSRCPS